MFPARFEYHRASSVDDAIRLLGEHDDAKLLAGGHSLIPMMKLRLAEPEALIDIGRLDELRGLCVDGDELRIGALTTHAALADSEVLAEHCPLIRETARQIADPAVRNRGTIGGSIAHADPASDLPAVLLALGATVHLAGPGGRREVAAADFFVDLLVTDLGEREVLTGISVPDLGVLKDGGSCYLKVDHPASGYAICGAAAVVDRRGARLCFNGITAVPLDAQAVTDALASGSLADSEIDAALGALEVEEPLGDVHASGEYRVELARVNGRRALKTARDRARG